MSAATLTQPTSPKTNGHHAATLRRRNTLACPSRPPQERDVEERRAERRDTEEARAEADAQRTEAVEDREGPDLGDIGSLEE